MKIESRFAHQLPKAKKKLAVKPQHLKMPRSQKIHRQT
jgi:hypothetical protein